MKLRLTPCSALSTSATMLEKLISSSFIPFASPSPSSTEKALADAVRAAKGNLDKAINLYNQLYTR